MDELVKYKMSEGLFGLGLAVRSRDTLSPATWWSDYGSRTPHLQKFAIKILSLTCSSSGCERNWSVFEHIHSKKRSKLEHQKLQDLVYIKYNQALAHRFDCRDVIDPILLDDIDGSNEWLMGQMRDGEDIEAEDDLPFEDHILNEENVGNVADVSEPIIYTRRRGREAPTLAPTHVASSSRGRGMEVDEEYSEEEIENDEGVHNNVDEVIDLSGSDKEEDLYLEDDD
ncbi:uncharacterized protein LOC130712267 [Lotus japonicus]|uniref:uncharacterized protein LOC130712267 n=1 Tax=Lotus japonicus TaxID=34305 RepID=UPI00258DC941|nr:uncharacterized protein LOC130712267 [Lotus japonicus]